MDSPSSNTPQPDDHAQTAAGAPVRGRRSGRRGEARGGVSGGGRGLTVTRRFTRPGVHPFDEVAWELRTAAIANEKGETVFEQRDCEVPAAWSQMATNVVVSKYFRGPLGSPRRETSVRQVISRVCDTITRWGREGGYFATEEDAQAFGDELSHLVLHQHMAFNSPVWFNVGVPNTRPQASACQPYHALVSTPAGMVPIGELVEQRRVGETVYDASGVTRIVAVKANGEKPVRRVRLLNGSFVEATPDHVVLAVDERRTQPRWVRVEELRPGMRLHLHPHRARLAQRVPVPAHGGDDAVSAGAELLLEDACDGRAVSEAALAGWLQADGFVGQDRHGTNGSLTVELQVAGDEEHDWVMRHLEVVFPGVHHHVASVPSRHPDRAGQFACRRMRLDGEALRDFVERWQLLRRGHDLRVPRRLWTASHDEVVAYLRSIFQAAGYVSSRSGASQQGTVCFAVVSERWTEDVQILLASLGIHSRRTVAGEKHPDRADLHVLSIGIGSERARFAELVGFPGRRKQGELLASLDLRNLRTCPTVREERVVAIDDLGVQPVFDIQTESGNYLSNNIVVHNCFINSVEDTMDSILNLAHTEGMLFKYGSGTGTNLSPIRSSMESLAGGGTASGPVSFMRGFDAFAGVIKSGGTTRRAAKMVILDIAHPDVEEFITCKVTEERKAWALIDAGYDGAFTGEAYSSIFFQNSNNSVRVTDDFMRAVLEDREWPLRAVTDADRVLKTVRARDLMRSMAECAWQCGDPGIQYDTTINDWHTSPNSGRINASNPCCFVGDTLVQTSAGPVPIADLAAAYRRGGSLPEALAWDLEADHELARPIRRAWTAGSTRLLVDVRTASGQSFRCTAEHRFLTGSGRWVAAQDLTAGMSLQTAAPAAVARSGGVAVLAPPAVDTVAAVDHVILSAPVPVYDIEVEGVHNFCIATAGAEHAVVVHNSEYLFLDDSACNLASINLMKYAREDGGFDAEGFRHAVQLTITAQEILVGNAAYPTEKIAENSAKFRPLGLGYANLGALLMSRGMPYDSPQGRATAACITAMMTGDAYAQSARIAREIGPFEGYAGNRQPMLRVIGKHREAAYHISTDDVEAELITASRRAWDEAHELGAVHGYRNAQATVLAPTGTISFMLDCDTTGVEPDIALVKYKKLVGGGMLKMVNHTVPLALRRLGYGETAINDIVASIDANDTIEGAPHLREEDVAVFDCAFKPSRGSRSIAWQGHVRMLAAVQPFLSGAASKTVNMPNDVTVDEVEQAYVDGWKMGLKALAIYRDGSKRSQPMATTMDKTTGTAHLAVADRPLRRRLPAERQALTHKFEISGHEGYITVGLYEDGTPGEIFLKMAKEGSTISGLMDSFATAISLALQYGVPLKALVDKFSHTRFEPSGFTGNPEIPIAKSIMDYIFRWLASRFMSWEERDALGIIRRDGTEAGEEPVTDTRVAPAASPAPPAPASPPVNRTAPAAFLNQEDAPSCSDCGSLMVRSGACYKCLNCGATSGCS